MRRWLVGVDGSERSLAALRWAARAIGCGGHLEVVDVRATSEDPDDRTRAVIEATPVPDGIEVTVSSAVGDVAERLRDRAEQRGADAIVVGVKRPRPFRRRRIGPVARDLLTEPSVAVVAVPEGTDAREPGDGPVVVGAGHGVATDAAVDWAADFAIEHTQPLWLVRAIGIAPGLSLGNLANDLAYYLRPSQRVTWAVEDLHELSERVRGSGYDDLDIAAAAVRTTPSMLLSHASEYAALVVVGLHHSEVSERNRPDWTLRHVLTRARSPVAVVPADYDP